jgi:hypothetical protein
MALRRMSPGPLLRQAVKSMPPLRPAPRPRPAPKAPAARRPPPRPAPPRIRIPSGGARPTVLQKRATRGSPPFSAEELFRGYRRVGGA